MVPIYCTRCLRFNGQTSIMTYYYYVLLFYPAIAFTHRCVICIYNQVQYDFYDFQVLDGFIAPHVWFQNFQYLLNCHWKNIPQLNGPKNKSRDTYVLKTFFVLSIRESTSTGNYSLRKNSEIIMFFIYCCLDCLEKKSPQHIVTLKMYIYCAVKLDICA